MKELKFHLNGSTVTAQLGTRVEKKALYGHSKYIAEKDGIALSRGYLDPDGSLLQRAAMANLKLDPEGSPTEDIVTEIDGAEVPLIPSSFDREAPLAPLPYSALAGFNVSDIYPLEAAAGLPPGLYQTDFNYRKSVSPKEALILIKPDSAWLLSGVRRTPTYLGLSVAYAFFDTDDTDDAEDTDMDFGMV